jgi:hypothetical protein
LSIQLDLNFRKVKYFVLETSLKQICAEDAANKNASIFISSLFKNYLSISIRNWNAASNTKAEFKIYLNLIYFFLSYFSQEAGNCTVARLFASSRTILL